MTISDSVPIQFWDIDEETYNEKQICGVYNACFCLPVECTDLVPIQFTDDIKSAALSILDESDNELLSIDFDEVSDGVFDASFRPSEQSPDICNRMVRTIIVATKGLINEDFDTDISSWVNSGSGDTWVWNDDGGDGSANADTIGLVSTKYFSQDFIVTQENAVSLTVDIEYNGSFLTPGTVDLVIYGFNNGVPTSIGSTPFSDAGVQVINDLALTLGDYDEIGFRLTTDGVGQAAINIHYFRLSYTYNAKKSDCLDIRNTHDCTELLSYTNTTDFDGIKYDISPQPTFYLRIPAQFWKENNPMTQEDSELSNGVIVTRRQTIQEKTLLEMGFIPNWLHKKIQKVLMHETVIIRDQTYKRRDEYEAENLNRYPLKKGSVWLTKYNSVEKNTI